MWLLLEKVKIFKWSISVFSSPCPASHFILNNTTSHLWAIIMFSWTLTAWLACLLIQLLCFRMLWGMEWWPLKLCCGTTSESALANAVWLATKSDIFGLVFISFFSFWAFYAQPTVLGTNKLLSIVCFKLVASCVYGHAHQFTCSSIIKFCFRIKEYKNKNCVIYLQLG